MKARRIWAIARKETLHVVRDWRSLATAIAIPILLLVLFGWALSLDVDRVPLVVWDRAGDARSRAFVSRFTGSRYFALRRHVDNYRDLEREIDTGRALMALVIPRDLSPAQLIVDGSDSATAILAIGYAEAVAGAPVAIDVRPRVWFNPEMESRNYIIPGLIVVIMMVIAGMLTSLTVAREWEQGTMEQLISTPVKGTELILGKLLPYFAIGMIDVAIAVLMGEFVFAVPLRGSVPLLFATSAVFLVGALALGILISIAARSQLLASQISRVATFLPAFLLSGFIYPIENMPAVVRLLTYVVPARYFVTMLRGIYLKGVGLEILWLEGALLTAFTIAMLAAARLRFRKKL